MRNELTDEALEYGSLVARALESAGGDTLAAAAEADPSRRRELVWPVLAELGAWDLEPLSGPDEAEAAAALCRAAGRWALPYPVAAHLSRPSGVDAEGAFVVSGSGPAAPLEGLDGRWVALTLDGRVSVARPRPTDRPARKSAFVVGVDLEPLGLRAPEVEVALAIALPCWTLLGMLDRAMEMTRGYVLDRQQFGQSLSRFQSVQFQLTDAEVERVGVEELAKYALWSIETGRPEALDDALALRLAAVEAAEVVLRICHQLHGAIGFCDETPLSWLSRHSQPLRRLPTGPASTRDELARRIAGTGLSGLYTPEEARR
jgi:3-oxo-4-pregnene-20-carboxyl-CoA dehydrogenase alpha subunit